MCAQEVVSIENEAKLFIDESFHKLRSAEGAFELLLNFRNIRSRKSINEQMMSKFKDILFQYEREVDLMDRLFKEFQVSDSIAAPTYFRLLQSSFHFVTTLKCLLLLLKIDTCMINIFFLYVFS
jgi:hypothetical protein